MKNNKGFTLIELIATIGIMILIGLVIVNNMSGILSKQHDEDYNAFKKKLEDGACIYVELHIENTKENMEKNPEKIDPEFNKKTCRSNPHGCNIPIEKLIKAGYVEEDLKNPSTGNVVDKNGTVNVKWINDEKTCKMNG